MALGKVYDLDIRDGKTKEKIKRRICTSETDGLYFGLVRQVARTGKVCHNYLSTIEFNNLSFRSVELSRIM